MEKRRRGLGLRKNTSATNKYDHKEETPKKSKHRPNASIVSSRLEEKTSIEADREGSSRWSECASSQQITPKRPLQVAQSPVSPGLESMFPRMLGSPEIEVSWDWGCSQVPKDMLPPRRVKRGTQSQQPPPVVSPLIQGSRVLQSRRMSEEENQARLAFYKNVLSQASQCNKEKNSKIESSDVADRRLNQNLTTPKRPTKSPIGDRELINALLDDSANEFMLECSQAIEEQLKNGQINMGPIVSDTIPNQKHAFSPNFEPENAHKRVCHGKSKLNLFPENSKNLKAEAKTGSVENCRLRLRSPKNGLLKQHSSQIFKYPLVDSNKKKHFESQSDQVSAAPNIRKALKNSSITTDGSLNHITNGEKGVSTADDPVKLQIKGESKPEVLTRPVGNSNPNAVERRLPHTKQQIPLNNNSINYNNSAQKNENSIKYDSLDKFRRPSKTVCNIHKNDDLQKSNKTCNYVISNHPPTTTNPVITNNPINDNKTTQIRLTNNDQETKQKVADFTSLLDDGFDTELSSLDFESICSQETEVPKVCTQDEIEAKRKAALTRLMMKRRR